MLPVVIVGACCGVLAIASSKPKPKPRVGRHPRRREIPYRLPIRDAGDLEWDEQEFIAIVAEDYLSGNHHSAKILTLRALNRMYPQTSKGDVMRWPTVPGDDPGLVGLERAARARVDAVMAQAKYRSLIDQWGTQT